MLKKHQPIPQTNFKYYFTAGNIIIYDEFIAIQKYLLFFLIFVVTGLNYLSLNGSMFILQLLIQLSQPLLTLWELGTHLY